MSSDAPGCYRHPDQPTRIVCQRCGRPICPQCMVPGAVGFQCPECVTRGAKETRQGELAYGGKRTHNPRATSIALIAANVAVWLGIVLTGGQASQLVSLLALTPGGRCQTMPDGTFLIDKGQCAVMNMDWVAGAATGAPWQLITSGFAHIDLLHIVFNMLVLYLLGPSIEEVLGRARFLAVYFVSLVGGSAGVMLFSAPFIPTLGASGAIYGLLGATLLLAIKQRGDVRGILLWIGINVALSFTWANVSWEGHLGGLVGGAATAAVLLYLPKRLRRFQWALVAAVAAALVAVILARAAVLA